MVTITSLPFDSRLSPDQRNAVTEDVTHHGFTAAGALLELGRSEDQYVAVIAQARAYGVRHLHTAVPAVRRDDRKIDVAGAPASPHAIDPNNTTAWTSDPATTSTTSLCVATGSTRALSDATATCCSFVPPGGPSSMSRAPVLDDQHTHTPTYYPPVTYRRHIENYIRSGNTAPP